ncbi:hypothetical protein CEXT_564431 [Caerostris extrusa]|uniref:Uncharacterized protein n=1 Tax=Caerostris extrusa TaxID=172846 RepID=A0AAV4WBT9_CAEEX|nr:hypothetical protein CEXT_564431 [Caerostris extrusa]
MAAKIIFLGPRKKRIPRSEAIHCYGLSCGKNCQRKKKKVPEKAYMEIQMDAVGFFRKETETDAHMRSTKTHQRAKLFFFLRKATRLSQDSVEFEGNV